MTGGDAPFRSVDCRYFRGDKPCRLHKECAENDCPDRKPISQRILIVKLGAMGDTLRATVILEPLRSKYPEAQLIWLTRSESIPLLSAHPEVDRLIEYSPSMIAALGSEPFEAVYCPENDPDSAAVAKMANARNRYGITLDDRGLPAPATPSAETFWRLAFNDEMKFRTNRKTMPQLILESLELEPRENPYRLYLTETDHREADRVLSNLEGDAPKIGFNIGVGEKFPIKAWPIESYSQLHFQLTQQGLGRTLLLGGAAERATLAQLAETCPGAWLQPHPLPVRSFAALIARLDLLVTGDTLAAHLAVGVGTPVIVLVGPTAPQELSVYGQGEILFQPMSCAPCYRMECPTQHECMESIRPETVLAAIRRRI